jgi:isopenicillin N synthase-like dioxygenase
MMAKRPLPVSLATFLEGSPAARAEAAVRAGDVYREFRYLLLTDHGIDEDLMLQVRSAGQAFFDQPLEAKVKCLALSGLGYLPSPDSLDLPTAGNPASPLEQFIIHLDERRTPWPEYPREFRNAVARYNRLAETVSRGVVRMMAVSVGVPEEQVIELPDAANASFLKILAWQRTTDYPRIGQFRLAPHHDYAAVGLLKNDDRENGLQVQQGSDWVEVYTEPGQIAVFLGEQLTRWTDGRVTPCWHRVVNHAANYEGDGRRLSTCYFYNPGPMVPDVERYLAGRAKYCEACVVRLAGGTVTTQTWTRRFRWASY